MLDFQASFDALVDKLAMRFKAHADRQELMSKSYTSESGVLVLNTVFAQPMKQRWSQSKKRKWTCTED